MAPGERLMNRHEAAKLLGISPRKLHDLSKRGDIPCVRIGTASVRYDPEALRDWVKRAQETRAA